MQVQAPNGPEGILAAAFQNVKIKTQEEKAVGVEQVKSEPHGHSGVQRTGVEKSIGLYQGEPAAQDAMTKRITEIREKLQKLVNHSSGMELLGVKQEGYSLNADDVEKIETVIDQIQVKLAAYSDSYQPTAQIDSEAAEEILGRPLIWLRPGWSRRLRMCTGQSIHRCRIRGKSRLQKRTGSSLGRRRSSFWLRRGWSPQRKISIRQGG